MPKKQTVLKVDVNCEKCQTEIFAEVGKIKGIQSLAVNEEKRTLTVAGNVEPVPIFKALKKIKKNPEIVTVGPPKPKCPYCQYLQSVCNCGMGSINNLPRPLPPPVYEPYWYQPPPVYEPYWYQPQHPCYSSSSSYYGPRQCELVGVVYPPPHQEYYDGHGSCSIV